LKYIFVDLSVDIILTLAELVRLHKK